MAVTYILARNHKFEVSTDNTTYTTISGVNMFSLSREDEMSDVTTFDEKGYKASLATGRGLTLSFEGKWKVDPATGTRDTGQSLVDVSMKKFGVNRLRYYRVKAYETDVFTNEIGQFVIWGNAKPGETGEGTFETMNWSIEIESFGRPVLASGIYSDLYE